MPRKKIEPITITSHKNYLYAGHTIFIKGGTTTSRNNLLNKIQSIVGTNASVSSLDNMVTILVTTSALKKIETAFAAKFISCFKD